MVNVIQARSGRPYALVVHGGAGMSAAPATPRRAAARRVGLANAYDAGEAVLAADGTALDAVCAAVAVLEDDPVFNAGRGAALTARGTVEHDSAIMAGDGRGGAVAMSRHARHPVELARAIMEHSPHVLLADPPDEVVANWGLEMMENSWFVTSHQRKHLADIQRGVTEDGEPVVALQHGTVGAVALDTTGHLAAATSTGGIENQSAGRIGDSPILGAGTWARDGVVAVSCTGHGEAFLQGGVAGQLSARIQYAHEDPASAAADIIATEVGRRGAMGALIAVTADGTCLLVRNSPVLLSAWRDERGRHIAA